LLEFTLISKQKNKIIFQFVLILKTFGQMQKIISLKAKDENFLVFMKKNKVIKLASSKIYF